MQAVTPYDPIELPELQCKADWKITTSVFAVHLLALVVASFGMQSLAPNKNVKKLVVHTVSLKSAPKNRVSQAPAQAQPQAVAAAPAAIEEPQEVAAIAPAAKQPEKAEEKKEEPVQPAATPAKKVEAKKVEAKKPKPKPKAAAKPTPKPTPKPKPKPTPEKPKPEKTTQETTKQEKVKQDKAKQEKQAQEKLAQEKRAQEKRTQEKQAQEKRAREKAAQQELAKKQQASLNEALSSLNSFGTIEGKKSSLAKAAGKNAGQSAPSQIANLSSESLVAIDSSETANCTPGERTYYDELVSRLKLALKLPEYGEVKLQLTISRSGAVVAVKSVKSKSKKNADYVQKALPKLHLPPFGQNFTGEKEHTFRLTLSNELNY